MAELIDRILFQFNTAPQDRSGVQAAPVVKISFFTLEMWQINSLIATLTPKKKKKHEADEDVIRLNVEAYFAPCW